MESAEQARCSSTSGGLPRPEPGRGQPTPLYKTAAQCLFVAPLTRTARRPYRRTPLPARKKRFVQIEEKRGFRLSLPPQGAAAWVVENNRFQPWIFRLSIELQHRQRTHRIYTNMALPSISTPSSSGSIAPRSTACARNFPEAGWKTAGEDAHADGGADGRPPRSDPGRGGHLCHHLG